MKIRVGIYGYGNLGRGIESAIRQNDDMELVAVFTRREPSTLAIKTPGVPVLPLSELDKFVGKIDVLILCGGSATDLPEMTPALAAKFNGVDSFDNHSRIPEHIANVDKAANSAGTTAIVSCGWDPGMFSLMRVFALAALPCGETYTFWGPGLSQGHSDAIRRIDGVVDARQYTIPVNAALERVRMGENPQLSTRDKHTRECWVVAEEGADLQRIEREIKEMPAYFADYDTTVNFITMEEMIKNHSAMPHGGFVIRSGRTGAEGNTKHIIEYSLNLESNPEFTSSVLVCCARAVYKMNKAGFTGAKTIFDIPPAFFSPKSGEELRKNLL